MKYDIVQSRSGDYMGRAYKLSMSLDPDQFHVVVCTNNTHGTKLKQ